MIVIRYRVIRSTRLGSPAHPYVVVRVESSHGLPQDISLVAGPYADPDDAYRAMASLARMGA